MPASDEFRPPAPHGTRILPAATNHRKAHPVALVNLQVVIVPSKVEIDLKFP